MKTERTPVGCDFWFFWVLASTASFAVGYIAFIAINFVDSFVFGVIWFAVAGAVIGIAQGLVVPWKVSGVLWWVLASSFGFSVSLVVGDAMGKIVPGLIRPAALGAMIGPAVLGAMIGPAVLGAMIGASLGIAQWLVLQRYVFQAGWWVLVSALGLGMGLSVARIVGEAMSFLVTGVVTGAIYGAITGGLLVVLLRQPRRKV